MSLLASLFEENTPGAGDKKRNSVKSDDEVAGE